MLESFRMGLRKVLGELLGHDKEVADLYRQIEQREQHIAELEADVKRAEQTAHKFTEEARYTLTAAAEVIERDSPERGKELATIAHTLPYVFSGRRHWDDWPCTRTAGENRAMALAVTRRYGIELPDDPVKAVVCLLALSITVLKPEQTTPAEYMRNAWPAKKA